jgi:SAM-dependent methyltransferase
MRAICNVCGSGVVPPIYESLDDCAITTMNKLIGGRTQVYFCDVCSHLQTSELPDLVEYYAQEYEINTAAEDADQLYRVAGGKCIYRADHQAAVLVNKVDFAAGARVLDYGCAKSPTLKKVLCRRPDIQPFLFDVSERYIPFWQRFPIVPEWSVHTPSSKWLGTMDVVLSFYALEHVAALSKSMEEIKSLLKVGGLLYFIVPNVYQNLADFVVADHVNHFSKGSLLRLLEVHGFGEVVVDDVSHDSAFIVTARLRAAPIEQLTAVPNLAELRVAAQHMADYWREVALRIREFEAGVSVGRVAIYGAGFYGGFIASSLLEPGRLVCFVDKNEHLQGTVLNGHPICAPEAMPSNVTHVFVGLNPRVARASIAAIEDWQHSTLSFFFL